jgi:tetratricopeptide (TPR) repeat protein
VALAVFTAAAYALHQWQKSSRAVRSLSLGEAAYAAKDWDEAATQLGDYIYLNGGTVDVLLKYADAQCKKRPVISGNVALAINAYRETLRLDPGNKEATQRAIEVYQSMGSPGDAKPIAENYLKTHDDVAIRRMLADILWRLRDPKGAATELATILERHPEDILSYERMGLLAEQYRDTASKPAPVWFEDAIAKNPESAMAYIVRADFRLRQKDREKALADLEQAQKCDLSDTETRLRLVGGWKNANELDKAREHLQALQAKDLTEPLLPLLWLHWADLASRANSAEEMYTVAQTGLKALAAQPWDFMPVAAELLVRSGHLKEAGDCITQLRQKDIAPPAAAFLEGLVAEKQGQLREAVTGWRKAVTLGYRRPVVHMMLASALSRLGDTQSAIGQLRLLVTDEPGYLEGRVALAQLLAQTKEWPEVLAQAGEIRQLSPNHSEAMLLELQARTYLLAADTGPAAQREKAWQDIETRLGQLDKATDGALAVKLLQAQIAMVRGKLAEAASLLADLEGKYPSESRIVLLHAELCATQGKDDEAKTRFQNAVAKFPQALEPVRGLALFLDQRNQHQECESVVKEGIARIEDPRARRDLGLVMAEFYRQWKQEDKLTPWLSDLAVRFPTDIQPRRLLLNREEVTKDPGKAQAIIDEIKSLETEGGWQWRFEQARLWNRSSGDEFKVYYPQIVKLLQENLLVNPKDHASRLLLAATYEKANDLSLAVTTYREALGFLPNSIPVLVRTIVALNNMKEFDEARGLLDRAAQQNLQDPDLEKLRLQDDLRRGNLVGASNILEKMIVQDPNDALSSLTLALVRMREKKFDEAQKLLDGLKAKTPDSTAVTAAQINLYVQQGNGPEAIRLCDQTVEKLHNTPAYLLRARTHIVLKQNEKALEDFSRVIALEPQKAESWATRADFYRTIGRIKDGISDVKQALALAPDNVMIQRLAALLFIASRDMSLIGEAEAILDKALPAFEKTAAPTRSGAAGPARSPDAGRPAAPGAGGAEDAQLAQYTQLRLLKAQVLMLKGTGPGVEEARRILREITSSQPKLAEAWQWLAQLELSQEEPTKALDVALRGLAHNEGNGPLLLLKARAEKVRSPAMAGLTLKGLLDANPRNVDVLVELADAYARAGRTQQAVDLLRQKLPESEGPQHRRCELSLAEALYANGQKEEAQSLFDTLMQADPNDPTPTMTQAQLLRRERRWTEMNQLVRRWLTTHPQDADVATTIARALAVTGDKQALLVGEDILRTTLDRNPRSMSTLRLLSMMMQDAGRNEESAKLNRRILEIDPNSVIALNNLAWILCDGEHPPGQYQEAFALAQRGLKIVPDFVDLLDTRGYAYYRLGDSDNAMADFSKCIELYPTNSPLGATPRFHLAMTYAAMKRKAEATEQLRMALDTNKAYIRSAKEQADASRVTHAIKVLKDALKLQEQMDSLKASLGLQGQATGSSMQELTDAKALLDQLQKGNY